MRDFLAKLILTFAKAITAFSSRPRRSDVMARVRNALPAPTLVIDTDQGQLKFRHGHGTSSIATFDQFEPDTVAWISTMPEGSCLWDIGANVGLYSLYAALRPTVRVVAFEPAANSYAALNENIHANAMSDGITALCLALAKETRLDSLNLAGMGAGSWGNSFGGETNQFDDVIDIKFRQGAIGLAIDDFMAHFAPPRPTHIKIDVDGIEADILQGGKRTLSAPSVLSMIVEIEGDLGSPRNEKILNVMAALGFGARPKASPTLRNVVFDRPV